MNLRLRTDDFDYVLPESCVAQSPAEPRDSARMLVLQDGSIQHKRFSDLARFLRPGDCLVVNDTRVMAARLFGEKPGSAGKVEALLLREMEDGSWEALMRPGKRLRDGAVVRFNDVTATVISVLPEGRRRLVFEGDVRGLMRRSGSVPLPPYIKIDAEGQRERYQTVYADDEASAAAPTAGLHFTSDLLQRIDALGVHRAVVTLEIGWETFRPVRCEYIDEHEVHTERYRVSDDAAAVINRAKEEGGRIVAVGTTATRVLETVADGGGKIAAAIGDTSLFISPGYEFKAVDAMITNFHLPKTSLLMLVSAFSGRENVLSAYEEAVRAGYRFYSFGDAMLIL